MRRLQIIFASVALVETLAFVPNSISTGAGILSTRTVSNQVRFTDSRYSVSASSSPVSDTPDTSTFQIPREDVKPIVKFGKGDKEKVVNLFGLYCFFMTLITCPFWLLAMNLVHRMGDKDENRALYDKTGKIWSKIFLTSINSYPTITGNLDCLDESKDTGACLYVANHASWLDIPVLCTVLDPVFKFISKAELTSVPCIGTQLVGGEHMLIDRDDRGSQLKTFKNGIRWLRKGVPIMAFPEGQRSKDGRLRDFKGGLFLMAAKTKVPIVPITLGHTHAVMPSNSLFPIQSGRNKLRVHVHDPIIAEGKTEEELSALVRAAFMETLPLEQQPLPVPIPAPAIDDNVSPDETGPTQTKTESIVA